MSWFFRAGMFVRPRRKSVDTPKYPAIMTTYSLDSLLVFSVRKRLRVLLSMPSSCASVLWEMLMLLHRSRILSLSVPGSPFLLHGSSSCFVMCP